MAMLEDSINVEEKKPSTDYSRRKYFSSFSHGMVFLHSILEVPCHCIQPVINESVCPQ